MFCCGLISAWTINYINYKVWDEITYPFQNINGYTVEVLEWISHFIVHSSQGMWLHVYAGNTVNLCK